MTTLAVRFTQHFPPVVLVALSNWKEATARTKPENDLQLEEARSCKNGQTKCYFLLANRECVCFAFCVGLHMRLTPPTHRGRFEPEAVMLGFLMSNGGLQCQW